MPFLKTIETVVQPYAANILMTKTLLESILPASCGLLVGPWSDKFGRKPLLIASFSGFSMIYIITTVISILSKKYVISPWCYILAVIPESILGGNVVFTIAIFCYIADITTAAERPFRMALLEGCIYIGLMGGSFSASFIYAATNATAVFAISAGAIVISTVFILVFVEESLNRSRLQEELYTSNKIELRFGEIFNYKSLPNMIRICLKKRQNYDRAIILLLVLALTISVSIIDGQSMVFYLFVREKYQWSIRDFTLYEPIGLLVSIIGNLVGIFILRKIFNFSPTSLALIAFGSEILSTTVKAAASHSWQLYLAIFLGALKSIGNPMCRTILSNIVSLNELGNLYTFTTVFESIASVASAPLYTLLYTYTLTTNPVFFMYFSVGLYFIGYICITIIFGVRIAYPVIYESKL